MHSAGSQKTTQSALCHSPRIHLCCRNRYVRRNGCWLFDWIKLNQWECDSKDIEMIRETTLFLACLAAAICFTASIVRSDEPRKFWPITEHVEWKVTERTGVCQCGGTNKGVCYCLQSGIKCGCNASKGSVWNLTESGKPIGKTGEYVNPTIARANVVGPMIKATPKPHLEWRCNGGTCGWYWVK